MKTQTLLILILLLCVSLYGQTAVVSIQNVRVPGQPGVAANQFTFEIWLKNNSAVNYAYQAGQYGVSFNSSIAGTGTLSIITESSGLPTAQQPASPSVITASPVRFRWGQNAISDGGPFVNAGDSIRILTARVTNTEAFGALTPNLVLRTTNPDAVILVRYVSGNTGTGTVLPFSTVTYSNPALPVELSAFSAEANGRDVILTWVTQTELNSNSFVIERQEKRANNQGEWKAIGNLKAGGTSTTPKEYNYVDNKLQSGKFVYRLKMIDNDGTYEYSKEVEGEVALPKDYAISQNYPNPFNPTTRIDYQLPFDSKVTLELYGVTGEKVGTIINSELEAGYYSTEVNASVLNLASGVYIYRMSATGLNNQNFMQVKKLMLTK